MGSLEAGETVVGNEGKEEQSEVGKRERERESGTKVQRPSEQGNRRCQEEATEQWDRIGGQKGKEEDGGWRRFAEEGGEEDGQMETEEEMAEDGGEDGQMEEEEEMGRVLRGWRRRGGRRRWELLQDGYGGRQRKLAYGAFSVQEVENGSSCKMAMEAEEALLWSFLCSRGGEWELLQDGAFSIEAEEAFFLCSRAVSTIATTVRCSYSSKQNSVLLIRLHCALAIVLIDDGQMGNWRRRRRRRWAEEEDGPRWELVQDGAFLWRCTYSDYGASKESFHGELLLCSRGVSTIATTFLCSSHRPLFSSEAPKMELFYGASSMESLRFSIQEVVSPSTIANTDSPMQLTPPLFCSSSSSTLLHHSRPNCAHCFVPTIAQLL